jgi:hypothetical protein
MSFNKILYVGCGINVDIISHFPNTKEFIFVDSQPLNKFNGAEFYEPFYQHQFINIILSKLRILGFMIQSVTTLDKKYFKKIFTLKQRIYYLFYNKPQYINPSLLTFYNTNTKQEVKFYVSTDINYTNILPLYADIKSCDALLISKHSPSIEYLKYILFPINFVGYSDTLYHINSNDNDKNIIQYFHRNKKIISKYILDFYAIDKENGYIELCSSFEDFIDVIDRIRSEFKLNYKNNKSISFESKENLENILF